MTRPDLDGLTCAVLLSRCQPVDSVELVQPHQISEREVSIDDNDILANLPYHPSCGMWFDNHLLTDSRSTPPQGFRGRYGQAPSAARLVYEHYAPDLPDLARYDELVRETDRLDSARLELSDVLTPRGYVLLGFTLDPKSGLGEVREYFAELWTALLEKPIDEVLDLPSVRERVKRLHEQDQRFREAAVAHSRLEGKVIVTDFREVRPAPVGNRFLIYTLYPEATVSVRIQPATQPDRVSVSAGRSIFNRETRVNIGVLMSLYGGGGQAGAGACVIPSATADQKLHEIVAALQRHA